MALTRDEITAGGTYTVRFAYGQLSPKRFRDAVNYVRGIKSYEGSTSSYDAATRTWTVTLAAGAQRALADLRAVACAYDGIVERA